MMYQEAKSAGVKDLYYELDDMRQQAEEMESQNVTRIDSYLEDIPEDLDDTSFSRIDRVAAIVTALHDARSSVEEITYALGQVLDEHAIDGGLIPDGASERIEEIDTLIRDGKEAHKAVELSEGIAKALACLRDAVADDDDFDALSTKYVGKLPVFS